MALEKTLVVSLWNTVRTAVFQKDEVPPCRSILGQKKATYYCSKKIFKKKAQLMQCGQINAGSVHSSSYSNTFLEANSRNII